MNCWRIIGTLGLIASPTYTVDAQRQLTARPEGAPISAIRDQPFRVISYTALSPSGDFVVVRGLDAGVFDRSGALKRIIGREGKGPGEFKFFGPMCFVGDTLIVHDVNLDRLTFFAKDFAVLRTVPQNQFHPNPDKFGSVQYVLADGSLVALVRPSPNAERSAAEQKDPFIESDISYVRLRNGKQGEPTPDQTLVAGQYRSEGFLLRTPQLMYWYGPGQPWADGILLAVSPNGRWIAFVERGGEADSKTVVHLRQISSSTTGKDIVLPFAQKRLEDDTVDRWLSSVPVQAAMDASNLSRIPALGEAKGRNAALRAAVFRPKYAPSVRGLLVNNDGSVWLRREWSGELSRWDILGVSGKIETMIELAEGITPLALDGDLLWGKQRDPQDGNWEIVRLRVSSAK
jgi:hypothetical protein